jgi:hypothetical protein
MWDGRELAAAERRQGSKQRRGGRKEDEWSEK